MINNNATEQARNPEVKSNFRIKVYKDCAWAAFDQEHINEEGEVAGKAIGVYFMEKVDGKWKIVYLSRVYTSGYEDMDEEGEE